VPFRTAVLFSPGPFVGGFIFLRMAVECGGRFSLLGYRYFFFPFLRMAGFPFPGNARGGHTRRSSVSSPFSSGVSGRFLSSAEFPPARSPALRGGSSSPLRVWDQNLTRCFFFFSRSMPLSFFFVAFWSTPLSFMQGVGPSLA